MLFTLLCFSLPTTNMAAKRKFEDMEGHNDQIPVQTIFTFNDLCEDVLKKVAKYLPLEERAVFTRTSRMMGRCCNSLWISQKKLPSEFYTSNKYYYAAVLKCPNLTTFVAATDPDPYFEEEELDPSREYVKEVLATSCPRIESFEGPLNLLLAYLEVLKDRNCIKEINESFQEFADYWDWYKEENHENSDIKVLAENLIHLKSMTIFFDRDRLENIYMAKIPHIKILGRRVSHINIMSEPYEGMYHHFEPGDNLEVLEGGPYQDPIGPELPAAFSDRHPKLKKIGLLNVTANNLRILNQIRYLETVELYFDEKSATNEVLGLFGSLLSRHIHLKRLKIILPPGNGRNNEFVQAICELRPGIKYLDLEISQNLQFTQYNFFDHLHQLRDLREFVFNGCSTVHGWNINTFMPLFASWPKIKRVRLRPFAVLERGREFDRRTYDNKQDRIVAESEERIKEFTEEHHRVFIFTICKIRC